MNNREYKEALYQVMNDGIEKSKTKAEEHNAQAKKDLKTAWLFVKLGMLANLISLIVIGIGHFS